MVKVHSTPLKGISVRRDKNAISLFDRSNGTKVRFAIGPYTKAKRPELVDIKITDFCPAQCSFCYQGSTPSGEHSSMENMENVIYELSKARVQEVAMGGGETTYHPQFAEICKKFAQAGVVPNFTTKYPARVRMHWDNIKDYIGGFAYSAETPKNIYDAAKLLKRAGIPDHKVSLHHVMGLSRQGQFREYMQAAHDVGYRVTLLGYKTTGRGKNVTPFPYDWWIEEMNSLIREGRCPSTSIDTPLADQYDGLMPVESTMYHTREGAFSMYIDAVQMKMGASSFDESVDLVPFDKDWVARYKHL